MSTELIKDLRGIQSLKFQNAFNYISPADLEEILEWLEDYNYLSKKGMGFKTELWELFIKKIDEQDLQLEDYNFRVNSDGWEKITVDNEKYLINPENDIWEILQGGCRGEQLFTWDAAIRETERAGKRMPTDEEFSELLEVKEDMPNAVYLGNHNITSPWFGGRGTYAYVWSSSQSGASAWCRGLYSGYSAVDRHSNTKAFGFSVRCVK